MKKLFAVLFSLICLSSLGQSILKKGQIDTSSSGIQTVSNFKPLGNTYWGQLGTTNIWTKTQYINMNGTSITPIFGAASTPLQILGPVNSDLTFDFRASGGHIVSQMTRYEGTITSPTAPAANAEVGVIDFGWYDGTAWPTEGFAVIQGFVGGTGTTSSSNHESYMLAKVISYNSTVLTTSGKWGSDLSYTSKGWIGAGQLTGGTNVLGYSAASTVGITIYAPSHSASRPVFEIASTGNTTQNNGEIDFVNLSNTLQSHQKSANIFSTPSGTADGDQGATLTVQTKTPDGIMTNAAVIGSDQSFTFPHYGTGIGHVGSAGAFTSSLIVNADITTGTIAANKLIGTDITTVGTLSAGSIPYSLLTGTPSTSIFNKVTITAPATGSTLTILDGKTVTFNNTMTFAGTDAQIYTLPTTTATIARTDAAQTFTGNQTFSSQIFGPISSNGNTTSSNLDVGTGGTIGIASSSAPLLVDGVANISARTVLNGQTSSSIASGNSYTGVEVGDQPVTVAGTTALVSSFTVRGGALTISSGSVTDYTTAYFQARTSGASNTWNGWFKYGTTRLPAVKVDSLLTGTVTTDPIVVSHSNVLATIPGNTYALASTSAIHGNSTTTGAATTAVTVTIGSTLSNNTYNVSITPRDLLTAVNYYISAQTTTTFTVTFVSALTGSINFDYNINP